MTEHQIVGFGELPEQVLPRRLNERCRLPSLCEALAGTFEHGFGRFGQRDLMPAFGQPQ
ncbi:hypothetical protein D3C76_1718690 [compost metagenome]